MIAPRFLIAVAAPVALVAASGLHAFAGGDAAPMVMRHVVLFKFKPGATAAQVRAVEAGFAALPSKIDGIVGFEWGTDVNIQDLDQGYTHCFVVTLADEAARARYLSHPDHEALRALGNPLLDGRPLVIDYWTRP